MGWVDCNGNPREDNLIFVTSVIIGMPMSHQCKNAIREGQALALRDAETGGCTCPPALPCVCGAEPTVRLLKRGAWKATDEEIAANRRAESVRIRAAERLIPESA